MTTPTNFDVIEKDQFLMVGLLSIEENYVDGLTQIAFGFPITKLLLHTVIDPKNQQNARELRKAKQYLTMPTVAAIQLANLILASAKQSEERLLKDINENARDEVKAMLQNYTFTNPVQGFESKNLPAAVPVASKKAKQLSR